MGSMMMINLFNIVDFFWVGKLGADAIAGVSASSFFIWSIHSIMDISANGINALVAQNIGAGRPEAANKAAIVGAIIGLLLAFVVITLGLNIHQFLFSFMGLTDGVVQQATDYFVWFLYGIWATFTWQNISATFRGAGDTHTPMLLLFIALILNIILDPLLIFGYGPFPELGVKGSAIATVFAHFCCVVIGMAILKRREWTINLLKLRQEVTSRSEWQMARRIIKIGLPVGITGFIFSSVYIFLTPIIARFGTAAVAAIGIGHRIEGLAYFACVGFSFAAATLVGQNLGAGQLERAERAAWTTVFYLILILFPVSAIFILFPHLIIPIFISDPEVVAEGSRYLQIIGLCEIFMGLEIVLMQAFSGAGDTMPPMLVDVPLTVARIPLAYFLAIHLGWGPIGVWWAISSTTVLKGVTMATLFKMGRWKRMYAEIAPADSK